MRGLGLGKGVGVGVVGLGVKVGVRVGYGVFGKLFVVFVFFPGDLRRLRRHSRYSMLRLCIPVSKSVDTERPMWSAINPVGLERGSMLRLHAVGAKKFLPTGEMLRLRPNSAGKSR